MTIKPFLLCAAAAAIAAAAHAETIVYDENPAKFGDLDQHNTDCKRNGCGPTAAVNSFVFLQNEYPSIYSDDLVPYTGETPTQDDQAAVANALLTYMDTCCARGTYWGNFITGKQEYLDNFAPGTTDSSAESAFNWNPKLGGPPPGPGSGISLQTNTFPTIAFILNALENNQDLEIFITAPDGSAGHYVTVTGISWDTVEMEGYLSFVDPRDGEDHTTDIAQAADEPLSLLYRDQNDIIQVAVDESPVPEPGTLSLSLLILAACLFRYTRRIA